LIIEKVLKNKRKMTKLEKYIYKCALSVIAKIDTSKLGNSGNVSIPFLCDGVVDSIIYNAYEKRFTHVVYSYGLGDVGFSVGDSSAYFDDIEYRSFEIPQLVIVKNKDNG
jgi:hypothetical protein